MLNTWQKLNILFGDVFYLIIFRFSNKPFKKRIIWGRSPYLEYGPGIRTKKLKKQLNNLNLKRNLIYMQSHWPWYEVIIYIVVGKIFKYKIIFNQNGLFNKNYNKNHKFLNLIILFGLLSSDFIIYQSWYCYNSIKSIYSKNISTLLGSKKYCRLINPPSSRKILRKNSLSKKHRLLICNSFNKDRAYYSKYIYELVCGLEKNNQLYLKNIQLDQ